MLKRILPFLDWFKAYGLTDLRADILSGVTVALVLVPQSMAYAQLAGLPSYYGLYASFLPPLVAALFGSSRQLATGPVAVVSLMTAAALEPIAASGSDGYIAYAIVLALIVGVFQLGLGLLRLGIVVNFLSHPVVNGFTNAAAIIIATSQLSKLFGVHVDNAEHHYETIARVVVSAVQYTHWPTLVMALLSFAIMLGLKKLNPRIPYVLAAVVITTLISWKTGFENHTSVQLENIADYDMWQGIRNHNELLASIDSLNEVRTSFSSRLEEGGAEEGDEAVTTIRLRSELEIVSLQIEGLRRTAEVTRRLLRSRHFEAVETDVGELQFYPVGALPSGARTEGHLWRLKVRVGPIDERAVQMTGGGDVVGTIPGGLPQLTIPRFDFGTLRRLFGVAVIISLLGFMEAISIAKAMSVKTGQRLDPNQELIGQGLANIAGAIGQSYPTSGSFSRSAVNLQGGAVTGLSSVFTSAVVVIVLLFFTPLLYHLPQAVLATVIMIAVLGLVNVSGFVHAFRAKREDGIISVVSFACTLAFAPHLDKGIMIGVGLSIALFLYEYMQPRVTVVARTREGAYRDTERWKLHECRHVLPVRFFGKMFFANAAVLEKRLLELIRTRPELKHVVIVGNGISDIDSSGEEILDQIVDELRRRGIGVAFSGLRDPVLDVLARTRLLDKIGEDNVFQSMEHASRTLCGRVAESVGSHACPLLSCTADEGGPECDEPASLVERLES